MSPSCFPRKTQAFDWLTELVYQCLLAGNSLDSCPNSISEKKLPLEMHSSDIRLKESCMAVKKYWKILRVVMVITRKNIEKGHE